MAARVLTESEIDAYRTDGVVHIKDAVDDATVAELSQAVEQVIASPTRFGGSMTKPGRPGMYFQDRYLHPTKPDFARFITETGLASLAAQATRSEQIRLYFEHIFVKDPGTEENFVWHQDRPYWAVDGTQICSTWLALTASTVEASSLEFVTGSHLWDRTFRPEFPSLEGLTPQEVEQALWEGVAEHIESFDGYCPAFEDEPDKYNVVGFAVEPGDALLFDFRTVHRSGPNQGDRRRSAVSWRWLGDDAQWSPKAGADPIITDADTSLAAGDLIRDDAVFPLAYATD